MNILLDAGIAAVSVGFLGYGWFAVQARLVQLEFARALAAKNRGDYELAERQLRKCSQTALRLKMAALSSDACILACWSCIERGQFGTALQVLTAYPAPFTGLSPLVPTAWTSLQRNDMATAEAAVEQALRTFGRGTMAYASTLCVLGWLRLRQGRLSEAEVHLQESLFECQRITGGGSRFCVPPMMNLAWLYLLLGQFEKATDLSMNAVKIYTATLGHDSPRTASALALRGVIALVLNETDLALRDLYKARRLFKRHDLMSKPSGRCLTAALNWISQS